MLKKAKEKYNILYDHILNIHVSSSNHGNNFQSEKLRQFVILISFHGRSLMELLIKNIHLSIVEINNEMEKKFSSTI